MSPDYAEYDAAQAKAEREIGVEDRKAPEGPTGPSPKWLLNGSHTVAVLPGSPSVAELVRERDATFRPEDAPPVAASTRFRVEAKTELSEFLLRDLIRVVSSLGLGGRVRLAIGQQGLVRLTNEETGTVG